MTDFFNVQAIAMIAGFVTGSLLGILASNQTGQKILATVLTSAWTWLIVGITLAAICCWLAYLQGYESGYVAAYWENINDPK